MKAPHVPVLQVKERDDGLGAARGLLIALPASLLLWALILWAVP
jgi:hypothetical protein